MLATRLPSGTDTTGPPPVTTVVPPATTGSTTPSPSTEPPTTDPPTTTSAPTGGEGGSGGGDGSLANEDTRGIFPTIRDLVGDVWDSLTANGYQTGVALIVATVAVITMRNMKVKNYVLGPVALGAFWAGWLLWNTVTGQNNQLFPSNLESTKLWDVALNDQWGFLIAVVAGCVAAIALWQSKQSNATRALLVAGTVFGTSLIYNLVESIRVTSA